MSKALDFLINVRGEAIAPYFEFLKKAGAHLDTKTRDLISVITKVDTQTEKGLKQYLMRALRNGATANEVLDALLTAFPSLGLTKIVWAIDIILEMNLPEFSPEALAQKSDWHKVCPAGEVEKNKAIFREAGNRRVFVYSDDSGIRVYDSHCPHRAEDIRLEAVSGTEMTCPRHKWKFDLKTGKCIENGRHPLKEYKHKIENNELFIYF